MKTYPKVDTYINSLSIHDVTRQFFKLKSTETLCLDKSQYHFLGYVYNYWTEDVEMLSTSQSLRDCIKGISEARCAD